LTVHVGGVATAGLHVQMHVTRRFDVHTCMNLCVHCWN